MQTNGDGPGATAPDFAAAIDAQIAGLREAADAAGRLAAIKRTEYEDALGQAKRLQKALDALQPPAPKVKPDKHDWAVSEDRIVAVLEAIRGADLEEFTAADIVKVADGISAETVRKACSVLREREVLRLVRTGRAGGKILALMPDQR